MNLQTLKIELTKDILDIENPKLIEEILQFIQSKSSLSDNQKASINEALQSLEKKRELLTIKL
jgi:hypothetical protein